MPSSSEELEEWNAGVAAARGEYESFPISALPVGGETRAPGPVSRERYMEMVRANAALARALRETREQLEALRRRAALARMRGGGRHQ